VIYSLFQRYPATKNGKNTTILDDDRNVVNSGLVPAHNANRILSGTINLILPRASMVRR